MVWLCSFIAATSVYQGGGGREVSEKSNQGECLQNLEKMERETGIEPATNSLEG